MVHYRSVTQAVIAVAALCVLGMPNVSLAADKAEFMSIAISASKISASSEHTEFRQAIETAEPYSCKQRCAGPSCHQLRNPRASR
jgi:hypothetical protein